MKITDENTTTHRLAQYFRYEISYDRLIAENSNEDEVCHPPYYIQWQDIRILLQNLEEKNPVAALADKEWNTGIFSLVYDGKLRYLDEPSMKEMGELLGYTGEVPDCMAQAMHFVVCSLVQAIDFGTSNCPDSAMTDFVYFSAIREDVERLAAGDFSSIRPLFWSDAMKNQYLFELLVSIWTQETPQLGENFRMKFCRDWEPFSQEKKHTIHTLMEELVPKGYVRALELKAICCYGGNCIYACDWQLSHDYLIRLMNIQNYELLSDSDKCRYALLLGNIFYEGLLNGTPDYEKAAYYYSIGAIGEDYDCAYRLAKMNMLGLGVPKNARNAYILIERFYTGEEKLFQQGKADCQFAEAAYAMGSILALDERIDEARDFMRTAQTAIQKKLAIAGTPINREMEQEIKTAQKDLEHEAKLLKYDFPSYPDIKDGFFLDGVDIRSQSLQRLKEIYPCGIPDFAWERYQKELEFIISYDREKDYQFMARLSEEARKQGAYPLVRGQISGSFLLYLLCDNLYNPLPAHYYCPVCGYYELAKGELFGIDLPQKKCPVCDSALRPDGFSISLVGAFGVNSEQLQNRWDINVSEPFLHIAQIMLKMSGLSKITLLTDPFYSAEIEALQKKSGQKAAELTLESLQSIGWRELSEVEETSERNEYLRVIQPARFRQFVALQGALKGTFEGEHGKLPQLPNPYARQPWKEVLEKYPAFIRDDLYDYLLENGISEEEAAQLSEYIGKGKFLFPKYKDALLIPNCVRGLIGNVKYLMPRASIVEFLLADIRIACLRGLCPESQEEETDEIEVPLDEQWIIPVEKVRSILRFDQGYEHLAPVEKIERGFVLPQCQVKWDDIQILLYNLRSANPPVRSLLPWMWDVSQLLGHILPEKEKEVYDDAAFKRSMYRVHLGARPENTDSAKYFVLDAIIDEVVFEVYLASDRKERCCTDCIDFAKLFEDIELFKQGRFGETMPMFWSNAEKIKALQILQEDEYSREQLSKEAWEKCPSLLEELIDKEYFDALALGHHMNEWYK